MIAAPVEFFHLTKSYGRLQALRDLTLTIPAGAVLGLLGPNGAGKTTAIRILATLGRPSSGQVTVAGKSASADPDAVRRLLGYVPQEIAFPNWMSGRSYLRFAAALSGVEAKDRGARVESTLELVGLTEAGDRRTQAYSGGMRQRLGIAQALVHEPALLVLDEPVAALDPIGRSEVLELIRGIKGKVTVLLSSHLLDDVDRACDQVAILSQGKLLAHDSTTSIKERYGGPVFHVEVRGGAASLAQRISGEAWVEHALADGGRLTVVVKDPARAELELPLAIAASGLPLLLYRRDLPSLEEVFLRLVSSSAQAA